MFAMNIPLCIYFYSMQSENTYVETFTWKTTGLSWTKPVKSSSVFEMLIHKSIWIFFSLFKNYSYAATTK